MLQALRLGALGESPMVRRLEVNDVMQAAEDVQQFTRSFESIVFFTIPWR